jgi:DNA modification methylase/DNA-binding XRE family transcriptional regulator
MTKTLVSGDSGFGVRLSTLRKAAGLTQEKLAHAVGVSRRVIAYYEGETQHPPTTILPRLSRALGVSADKLLSGDDQTSGYLGARAVGSKQASATIYPIRHTDGRKSCVREVYHEDDLRIIQGDSRRALASMPDDAFQCCITSPPYWGLRDYGIAGQIGAEASPTDYIADLVAIFREVRRTLREDGTLWLNIGDSYTSGDRRWRAPDKKNPARAMTYRAPTPKGLKPKDLIGVPWRLALALQADGWFLRSDIIWNKPNCQPESVKDRPTRAHEYVFLMSKAESYFYDFDAILESSTNGQTPKNRRTVWNINTNGFHGAHFAVFPPELVRLCLLAGSKPGSTVLDPFFGSGTVGQVCREYQRNCVGIELNPEYVKIALDRIRRAEPTLPLYSVANSQ